MPHPAAPLHAGRSIDNAAGAHGGYEDGGGARSRTAHEERRRRGGEALHSIRVKILAMATALLLLFAAATGLSTLEMKWVVDELQAITDQHIPLSARAETSTC